MGGGAPRCYPQTPSPAPGNSWHGSDAGSNTTPSTSIQYNPRTASLPVVLPPRVGLVRDPLTHTGAGGWVLRSGCADPFPARPCLGGPEAARRGGLTPPLRAPSSPALPNAIDLPRRERVGESAERDETLPPDPLRIFRRPGDTSPAVLPSSPPWMDLIPPRLAPSWPLRWA